MRTLATIILVASVPLSQAIPRPQNPVSPAAPGVCNNDWTIAAPQEAYNFLKSVAPEPIDQNDLTCRNATASHLEGAVKENLPSNQAGPHTECPKWFERRLPFLSACDYATTLLVWRIGGPNTWATFGDQASDTCKGQLHCLPIHSDHNNCRVHLEFDPVIPALQRKDEAATFDIAGKELYLEVKCAVFL